VHIGIVLAALSGWYLCGLSVTVGLVVYPSFSSVDDERWITFHQRHSQRISYAVALPWLVEAVGLSIWLIADPRSTWLDWTLSALGALASVLLTIAGAIPAHQRLGAGFDQVVSARLIKIHWWRTGAWIVSAGAATAALLSILS
jgi:uncharacterized PurR-regulated membrane protein YhhQ (DUF165 family)